MNPELAAPGRWLRLAASAACLLAVVSDAWGGAAPHSCSPPPTGCSPPWGSRPWWRWWPPRSPPIRRSADPACSPWAYTAQRRSPAASPPRTS